MFLAVAPYNQLIYFHHIRIHTLYHNPYNEEDMKVLKRAYIGCADVLYDAIFNSGKKIVCINDADSTVDFEKEKVRLTDAFERKFPEKSSFEL